MFKIKKSLKFNSYIIIIFNSLIFALNILFLRLKVDKLKVIIIRKFKASDKINIFFMNKTHFEIASYLNNKFDNIYYKRNLTLTKHKVKKTIKLCFFHFFKGFNPNAFIQKLDNENFNFKIDNNTPEYVFYCTSSKNHTNPKYRNAIKIAIFNENKIPDLNEADYSIGHIHLTYLDRYFKYFKYFTLKTLINIIKY